MHKEKFLQEIVNQSPTAMIVYVGQEMVVELANEKMLQLLGRDPSIIGKPILEAVPELEATGILERYRAVIQTGDSYVVQAFGIELVKNNQPVTGYYDYAYNPIRTQEGEIFGVVCTAVEVTDRVIDRLRALEAEVTLKGAVELAQLGTWKIEVATGALTYSDRLIGWFGLDPAAQNYAAVIPILEPADQLRVEAAVARALKPDSDGTYEETYAVIHPKTGKKRILHAQGKTVFDHTGKAIRMNGTAQDITIQHELQLALELQVYQRTKELADTVEALQQSNDHLQQFAYVASHDLQEPIRKIILFSSQLEKTLLEANPVAKQYLDKISNAALRMSGLVRDLLAFSTVRATRDDFQLVNLNEIFQHTLSDYDALIEMKQASVHAQPLPLIEAIPLQMTQLLDNLLSNSLKYSAPDRTPVIELGAVQHGGRIQLTFSDNGIGFRPQDSEKIFDIFQRLHNKNKYEGTGIGLALCKKIIQQHGGTIAAVPGSKAGAVFVIDLPLRQVRQA